MVHTARLKNAFYRVRQNEHDFDMALSSKDLAYYTACLAVGEDLNHRVVTEYRGQDMHVEDIAAIFLQASEQEADKLFYLGCWPDVAWRRYQKGNRIGALLIAVNYVMVGNPSAVST